MKRLEKIASYSRGYNSLCDVGSDHGYVCIEAVTKYNVDKAYALDINEGPLLNASSNIYNHNLNNKIKTILSDGLKNFNEDAELCVIAGMGGVLISKILEDSIIKANNFKALILEPNNEASVLREFLFNHDFSIIEEDVCVENRHYYEIMKVVPNTKQSFNILDIKFGPILRVKQPEEFKKLYNRKLEFLNLSLKNVKDNTKREEIISKIKEIEEVIL